MATQLARTEMSGLKASRRIVPNDNDDDNDDDDNNTDNDDDDDADDDDAVDKERFDRASNNANSVLFPFLYLVPFFLSCFYLCSIFSGSALVVTQVVENGAVIKFV